MYRLLIFFLPILLTVDLQAQELSSWTLQKCIEYGLENSLNIQQSELSVENADISLKSAIHQRFPSLSASTSGTYSIGRSVDPTTNDFISSDFFSNGISLSSGIVLFDGLRINNSIRKASYDKNAAREDMRQWQRDVAMNIATGYMAILFATENLDNAINQYNGTKEQLDKIYKLIDAGARPVGDKYDIEAQIALDEQNIIRMQNDLEKSYLDLKNLIRFKEDHELKIAFPNIDGFDLADPDQWQLEELYVTALNHQPSVIAGELRIKGAQVDEKIAKASYYPRLSIGGSLSTNYSDQAMEAYNFQNVVNYQNIVFQGIETEVGFPSVDYDLRGISYQNQIRDNIGFGAGIQLSIPIYSNYMNKANVSRAKIGTKNVEISNELEKQRLKSNINLALSNAKAAKRQLAAARKSTEAFEVAFKNVSKRYELGQIGSYEFLDMKNKLDNSKTTMLISRYDYIFSLKVIDFYRGLPLNF